MPENEEPKDRAITMASLIVSLAKFPEVQMLLQTIQPFIPLILREGQNSYNDFISYAVEGKWTDLDIAMWEKMTEDERDLLSNQILRDARIAVDNQFQRNTLAKKMAFKVALSLLSTILL